MGPVLLHKIHHLSYEWYTFVKGLLRVHTGPCGLDNLLNSLSVWLNELLSPRKESSFDTVNHRSTHWK